MGHVEMSRRLAIADWSGGGVAHICARMWAVVLADKSHASSHLQLHLDFTPKTIGCVQVSGISEGILGLEALEDAYRDDLVSNLVRRRGRGEREGA